MIVGAYTLHLYCDTEGCPKSQCTPNGSLEPIVPFEASDDKKAVVFRRAARAGWVVRQSSGECYCPECAKRINRKGR